MKINFADLKILQKHYFNLFKKKLNKEEPKTGA